MYRPDASPKYQKFQQSRGSQCTKLNSLRTTRNPRINSELRYIYCQLIPPLPRDESGSRGSAGLASSGSRMLSIMRDIRVVASLEESTTEGQYD